MEKVKLTIEEYNALRDYLEYNEGFEEQMRSYVAGAKGWTNTYLPLRMMGLEKFTKALIVGYELLEPKFKRDDIRVEFNYGTDDLKGRSASDDIIYLSIGNDKYAGITIEEAEFMRESLKSLIKFYNKNFKND